MKPILLHFFLLITFSDHVCAQFRLSTKLSASYDCLIYRKEEGDARHNMDINNGYIRKDTFLFQLQRNIVQKGKNWFIEFTQPEVQKTGVFRHTPLSILPKYPVDERGAITGYLTSGEKRNPTEYLVANFLKTATISFPEKPLTKGLQWESGNEYMEQLQCTVTESEVEKFGRRCFKVSFRTKNNLTNGEIFWDIQNGTLVYLEYNHSDKYYVTPRYTDKIILALHSSGFLSQTLAQIATQEAQIAQAMQSGQWAAPLIYDRINPIYARNRYSMQQGGLFGLLNADGQVLLKPEWEILNNAAMRNDYIGYRNNRMQLIDENGNLILDSLINPIARGPVCQNKKHWVVMNPKAELLHKYPSSQFNYVRSINDDGLVIVEKNRKYGLMWRNDTILPLVYERIDKESPEIIITYLNGVSYLFNYQGKLLYERKGNPIRTVAGNMIGVEDEGIFNKETGACIWADSSDKPFIYGYYNTLFGYYNDKEELYWLLNGDGKLLGKYKKISQLAFTAEPWLQVTLPDYRQSIVDLHGNEIVPAQRAQITSVYGQYYATFAKDEQYIQTFDQSWKSSNSTIPIKHLGRGRFLFGNPNEIGILEPAIGKFYPISPRMIKMDFLSTSDDVFIVTYKDNKEGLMDSRANVVAQPIFDKIVDVTDTGILVKLNGKMGILKR
ncbi:MAG: cache domain-containing protein [Saprospiraceae bacterium]|nr:cache domain-containing protein [Saprospiraceae bacterium]